MEHFAFPRFLLSLVSKKNAEIKKNNQWKQSDLENIILTLNERAEGNKNVNDDLQQTPLCLQRTIFSFALLYVLSDCIGWDCIVFHVY